MVSPTAAPAEPRSLFARLTGVILSPSDVFPSIVAHPRWFGALAATVGITTLTTFLFLSTDIGRQAMLDQQVASMEGLGIQVSNEQYAQMQARSGSSAYLGAGSVLVVTPLVFAAIAGILLGVFNALLGGEASYKQVFTVVAHCGAISILQQIFIVPLNYVRESLSSPTNLAVFFPMLDEGGFLAGFLGSIDLFLVWQVVVLAIGLAVLYRRPMRSILMGLGSVYLVIALGIGLVKSLMGG
ncbi:MAG: YIP1 family protein [Acidobacteria bacterium]|nr:YIP1 family protein [Acidobacteriota bacterium]